MDFNTSEFLKIFFGTTDGNTIVAGGFMCLIGWLVSLAVMVANAVKKNRSTPNKFSFAFFWADSWPSLMAGLICAFSLMRFSSEAIGAKHTMFIAFVLGFANMTCIQLLRAVVERATNAFNQSNNSQPGGRNKP